MDIREKFEFHIKKHKNLFKRYCYIQSDDGLEEYEILCTERKVKEQFVAETKNTHKQSLILNILLSDLKQAKNMMDENKSNCPTKDFTGYKIVYNGNNYVVYQTDYNGSFNVSVSIYCRLI